MPTEPMISVSGLRGIVGESLTPDGAVRYVAAFCATLPKGPIVVTHDGRTTHGMLLDAVCAAVAGSGRVCCDAGLAATPTTGVLVRENQAAGGIQISASHNPAPYNGIKLFSAEGRVIPDRAGQRVLRAYRSGTTAWARHDQVGRRTAVEDAVGDHLSRVVGIVSVEKIRDRSFRVVLDSNHGAGSRLGRPLLDALGCRDTLVGEAPTGQFAHPPEPLAENLAAITDVAQKNDADVVFCQDPDADRLAVIDENGRYLGEECTLALCVEHILADASGRLSRRDEKSPNGQPAIVTNCSTSRMTEEIAKRFGASFFRAAVGEANVVDAMLESNAILGGEGNGGVIDPRVGWVRDSFVGMALLLDSMASTGKPISELADALPRFAIHKSKIALHPSKVDAAFDALESHFSGASSDRLDGLRLDWPDGNWLLVRASNTEPVVRVIAEAKTANEAARVCVAAEAICSGNA